MAGTEKKKETCEDFYDTLGGVCPACQKFIDKPADGGKDREESEDRVKTRAFAYPCGRKILPGDGMLQLSSAYFYSIQDARFYIIPHIAECPHCHARINAFFRRVPVDPKALQQWHDEREVNKKNRHWSASHPMPRTYATLDHYRIGVQS